MQKIISCRVTDEYVQGTGAVVGAVGSHNDTALELSFSEIWDGTTKIVQFKDALGQNPTERILTVDLLVPGEAEVYRVPIPAEAKRVSGDMMAIIRGVVIGEDGFEDKCVATATAYFVVLQSDWDEDASEEADVTPSLAEQLQGEIDDIKMDIIAAVEAVKKLDEYVETTGNNAEAASLAEENAKKAQAAAAASATAASNSASMAGTNAANAAKSAEEAKQAAEDVVKQVIPIEKGGTGASSAADALDNLGAVAWDNVTVLTGTSILAWAEAQTHPTSIAVRPGTTDMPEGYETHYWFVSLAVAAGGDWRYLTAKSTFTDETFTRLTTDNGTWKPWNKVYSESNKPTATDVGALPLSGGTMTGRLSGNHANFTGVIRNGVALNAANVKCNGLADETVIKTKIPYTAGGYYMPYLHITGFSLNGGGLIDIMVGLYPYNGSFGGNSTACAVSRGSWKPTIKASTYTENGTEYVAVSLIGEKNFFGLKVDYGDVIQLTDACYGWTVEFNYSVTSGKSIVPTEKLTEIFYASIAGVPNIDEMNAAIASKASKPSFVSATMTAAGWSGNTYSFEATYPKASYDISIEVAPTATAEQFEAFGGAMICGSADSNIATALSDVPTVDIPIIIKVVAK